MGMDYATAVDILCRNTANAWGRSVEQIQELCNSHKATLNIQQALKLGYDFYTLSLIMDETNKVGQLLLLGFLHVLSNWQRLAAVKHTLLGSSNSCMLTLLLSCNSVLLALGA